MDFTPFAQRAQLERRIADARQLRAETLATAAAWSAAGAAFADIFGGVRHVRQVGVLIGALVLRRA